MLHQNGRSVQRKKNQKNKFGVCSMFGIKDNKEGRNIALAFFDVLGTSALISHGSYQKVYKYYSLLSKLCSEEEIPIAFSRLPGTRSESNRILLSCSLHHAYFSDTFIIWIEINDDDEQFGLDLQGFYEKCMEIFIESIKQRIPLRGAIAKGLAIMDEENKLFLGKPIVDAVKAEKQQNWMGIGFTASCQQMHIEEARLCLPYTKHIKKKANIQSEVQPLFVNCVLDWPKYWRETESQSVVPIIEEMNQDEQFSSYYDNAVTFVKYSLENNHFWEQKLPSPRPLRPFIVLDP